MTKFLSAKRYGMTNAVHFSVDEAFDTRLAAAAFTQTRLAALVPQFSEALADEDKYLQLSRASSLSAEIGEADSERDKHYLTVKQVAAAWADQALEPQATAAKAVKRVIDTYKISVRSQLDKESGLMTNLITDITATGMAAHLTTLGLTETVAKMSAANETVKELLASRADERAQQVAGALKAARQKCDEVYDEIAELIESLSVAAEDTAPYTAFISEWNEEIKRVKQQTTTTRRPKMKAGSADSADTAQE